MILIVEFFLLAFAKYLVFDKEFDFSNEDTRSLRMEIRTELIASKIHCQFGTRLVRLTKKRKSLGDNDHSSSVKLPIIQRNLDNSVRRFWNHDNEVRFKRSILNYSYLLFCN